MSANIPCLLALKSGLKFSTRPNIGWRDSPEKLIGVNDHNSYPTPCDVAFPYIVISIENNFIFPSSYMLQGRKAFNFNFLVSWTFEGLGSDGKWDLLHSCTGCAFSMSEKRNYSLNTKRKYSAFNITMTEKDTSDQYVLCLGQIEVYGMIFNERLMKMLHCATCKCKTSSRLFVLMMSLQIIWRCQVW